MKKLLSIVFVFIFAYSTLIMYVNFNQTASADSKADFSLHPADFVRQIGVGWNLGNTLDSIDPWGSAPPINSELDYETASCNPFTTKGMIDFVASAGFNAVRIPISWQPHTQKSGDKYKVSEVWLNRVKTIVDWCYSNDMFVIIDIHHDDYYWLNISVDNAQWEEVKKQYTDIWTDIAEYFKDYDEKLIFEGANELTASQEFDGCGTSADRCWWGHSQIAFDRCNELFGIFVETVRNTGSNNTKRYLMFPTYGAQWYANQVNKVIIPNNDEHIIIDIHWYDSSQQTDISQRKNFVAEWKKFAEKNNCGVILGECGFQESKDDAYKEQWANDFVADLRQNYKIPVFLWDDGANMRIMERKSDPYIWSANSQLYVKAVTTVGVKALAEDKVYIKSLLPTAKPTQSITQCIHSTQVLDGECAPTYYAKGYTGDAVCASCKALLSKGKKIQKLKLKKPKVTVKTGKKKLKFKLNKARNASGFEVKYKFGKKVKLRRFKAKNTSTKYIRKLKSGKYKVRIRAYVKKDKNIAYSKFTKAKIYKVK